MYVFLIAYETELKPRAVICVATSRTLFGSHLGMDYVVSRRVVRSAQEYSTPLKSRARMGSATGRRLPYASMPVDHLAQVALYQHPHPSKPRPAGLPLYHTAHLPQRSPRATHANPTYSQFLAGRKGSHAAAASVASHGSYVLTRVRSLDPWVCSSLQLGAIKVWGTQNGVDLAAFEGCLDRGPPACTDSKYSATATKPSH